MNTILFTHIPKTAGDSMEKSIISPNVKKKNIKKYGGIRDNLFRNFESSVKYVDGHYPYGIHYLSGMGKTFYMVLFREPVERCISYYYFIIKSKSETYQHPFYECAKNKDIVEFYSIKKFQNDQTKYVSGIPFYLAGKKINMNYKLRNVALYFAKYNIINKYDVFGLKERFKDSVSLFASKLGVEEKNTEKMYKAVPSRPRKEDFSRRKIEKIKELNSADMRLYRFAKKHFDSQ